MSRLDPKRRAELRERTLNTFDALPEQIGRYRIRGELGRGGMGIVHDAFDPLLERNVAVKLIHREQISTDLDHSQFAERFEKEMRATSGIFHRNVVSILDAGIDVSGEEPQAYYVMERIDGESLEERLRERGTLSRREALAITGAVVRGLGEAHEQGLVHRDLKPANILLPSRGEPKIGDFGLCQLRQELGTRPPDEGILGSPRYISPEQILGEVVTPAADFFSLGVVLIRMLTGVDPFHANTVGSQLQRVLQDAPDGLDQLDSDLQELVVKLLAKQASRRPARAGDIRVQFDALLARSEEPARPRRLLRLASSAVASLMIALAGSGLMVHRDLSELQARIDAQWAQMQQLAQRETTPRHRVQDHFSSQAYAATGTRNRLEIERSRYNEAVRTLNQRLGRFPWSLAAGSIQKRPFAGSAREAASPRKEDG